MISEDQKIITKPRRADDQFMYIVSYLEHAPDVYVTFSWRTLGDPSSHDEPLTDKHEADNRR